jgi:hypothetical protein
MFPGFVKFVNFLIRKNFRGYEKFPVEIKNFK